MRQFDVFQNPVEPARGFAPYLVVLSSHHLVGVDDAVVAPLVNDSLRAISALEIAVEVHEEPLVLVITELSSIRIEALRRKVASLSVHEDAIRRALDRLFTGF